MRSLTAIIIIALVALSPAAGRSLHRAAKPVSAAAAPKSENVPEQKRDPADVALDRKIKGICRGC
jgi:hypothetical protein